MRETIAWAQPRFLNWFVLGIGIAAALVIVWLPAPFGVGLALAGMFVVTALALPAIVPLALVLSVPVQDVVRLPVGPIGITVTQVGLAGTAVLLPIVVLAQRIPIRLPGIARALTVFLLVQVASLAIASNVLYGVASLYRWGAALLAFLAIIHLVHSRRQVVFLAAALALAALAEVAFGTLQSALGIAPPSFAVAAGLYRAYGTFSQPNPYAGYLEMVGLWLLPLALWSGRAALIVFQRYRAQRWRGMAETVETRRKLMFLTLLFGWLTLGVVTSFVGILLSFSRGGWVGTVAGLAVLLLFAPKPVRRFGLVAALTAILFLLAGGWQQLPQPLRERAVQLVTQARPFDVRDVQLTDANWAVVERMVHWQAAWGMFLDHPLTGVGAGNFSVAFPEYSPHPLFRVARGHAHNYYLHVLAELGIPGFLAYAALVGVALVTILRALRRPTFNFDRSLALGTLAATVAVLVHNLVENLHELHLSVHLLALWGFAWHVQNRWRRDETT